MIHIPDEVMNTLLQHIAEWLDIPDHLYEEAVEKYTEVGHWLEAHDVGQGRRKPDIYPQGSFRLGTMIRPLTDREEFDIDLVYKRYLKKESITQRDLKTQAGANIRAYIVDKRRRGEAAPDLDESRRCWTLTYEEDRFHMDVLPAIPDLEAQAPKGILITDRDLREWLCSNPVGYAEWFKQRMCLEFEQARAALAASIQARVEDVPEWRVKTPLQRAIQLLKRHRDIHFQDDQDDKPVSIIITTLAAKAYRGEANVYHAMLRMVREMPKYIEFHDGEYWVPNPVQPNENFADKWNERPALRTKFLAWLKKAEQDLVSADLAFDLDGVTQTLRGSFGRSAVDAAAEWGKTVSLSQPAAPLAAADAVPSLASTAHARVPLWPQRLSYKARITATVHKKVLEPKKLWELNSNRPLPKGLGLRFQVVTNTPPPYETKWQVVNTGVEAVQADGLRGGFDEGDGPYGRVRWESTAYAGTHMIEALVIKNGSVVARTGRFYVRIRK